MIPTTSLATSRELKENGFRQTAYFTWARRGDIINGGHYEHDIFIGFNSEHNLADQISAPTSDEILKDLPNRINPDHYPYDLMITKGPKNYSVWYVNPSAMPKRVCRINFVNESLPEALAAMWLFLKKEGLIKLTTRRPR